MSFENEIPLTTHACMRVLKMHVLSLSLMMFLYLLVSNFPGIFHVFINMFCNKMNINSNGIYSCIHDVVALSRNALRAPPIVPYWSFRLPTVFKRYG